MKRSPSAQAGNAPGEAVRGTAAVSCAAAAVLLASLPAGAADSSDIGDLSLEELMELRVASVYGASKYDQKVTQAPSSVSIVTAEEIRRFGYRTLAEVLRGVRGMYVVDDRNYSYLGVRGFNRPGDYNTRVLVTVDGHRMNDNVYDNGAVDRLGMVDVELIERVEVIRGPSSSIYGSSAFLAVVNVITRRGADVGGGELVGEAGSLDARRGRITYGSKLHNGAQWLLSGSHYESAGAPSLYYEEFDQRISDDPRAAYDGLAHGLDDERAYNVFGSYRHDGLTLSAFYSGRHKHVPTASYGTVFNDGREATSDYRGYIDATYERYLSEGLQLRARVFYDDYRYRGWYPYDYAEPGEPPETVVMKDGTIGQWVGTEWQLTANLLDRHKVIVGTEYRENLREYQQAYDDIEPRVYYALDDRSSRMLGLYAQSETRLSRDLALNAGLRFDRYSEGFDSTLHPRVALIYSPSSSATLKALYGEAFRAPNPFERHYNIAQADQPALEPETIHTYELAYEQYFGHRYRLSVSTYHYDVHDLINQVATAAGDPYFRNLDKVHASGLEIEGEAKLDSGVRARASYALQRAEEAATGSELTSSPRHLAKLNLSVPLYAERVFASLEVQHHSASIALDGARADPFMLVNLTLFVREPVRGLEISARFDNLFDERYGFPGAEDHLQRVIEQNGRTVHGTLRYKF